MKYKKCKLLLKHYEGCLIFSERKLFSYEDMMTGKALYRNLMKRQVRNFSEYLNKSEEKYRISPLECNMNNNENKPPESNKSLN